MNYSKVASTSTSCLEAHAGFFRVSMKGKFDVYWLWAFGKKVDFHIINTNWYSKLYSKYLNTYKAQSLLNKLYNKKDPGEIIKPILWKQLFWTQDNNFFWFESLQNPQFQLLIPKQRLFKLLVMHVPCIVFSLPVSYTKHKKMSWVNMLLQ